MENNFNWKKSFFTLYIGQAFSLLSSTAVQFAIIWWITVKTGSAIALTIASIVGLAPQILIGLFAGVWIDRHNRKVIMIIADSAVALSSLALGLSFFFGEPMMVFVYCMLFTRALGETFHKPALQAAIPQLVPKEELTRAGGLGQMVSALCSMAGPMLGALLISFFSLQYVMLVDIAGAVMAILMLSFVKIGKPSSTKVKGQKISVDLKQGFKELADNKALLRITVPVFLTGLVFMPLGSLLPLMVKEYFHGQAWNNGVVQTLFSFGMLASALIIGLTSKGNRPFRMISVSALLLGICSLFGGLIPANAFWLFCLIVLVMGTTGMLSNIPYMAYIQKSVAPENMGKVISFVTSLVSLGIPIGMLIAGPVAERLGVNNWMIIAGISMIFVGLISYFLTRKLEVKKVEEVAWKK